jgi:hypothetical protein
MHRHLRLLLKLTEDLQKSIKRSKMSAHRPNTTIEGRTVTTNTFSSATKKKKVKFISPAIKTLNKKASHRSPKPPILQASSSYYLSVPVASSHRPSTFAEPQGDSSTLDTDSEPLFKEGCRKCQNLSSDEKCRRYIFVKERPIEEYVGCVLTCTDDISDRLPPLVGNFCIYLTQLTILFAENEGL